MNGQEFLSAVLADRGMYCITTISRPDSQGKTYTRNMPFVDLGTAYAYAIQSAPRANVYFALSTFETGGDKFSRKAVNARYQKSFWLDLDCDADKATSGEAFPSKEVALAEFNKFLNDTGLPRPIIVDSGNGYHVYWALSATITSAQWRPLAECLRRICKAHGLIVDHHRTCDLASVLRVPDTYNHKHEAKPVRIYELNAPIDVMTMAKKLLALGGKPSSNTPTPKVALSSDVQSLMQSVGGSFGSNFNYKEQPPRAPHQMVIRCKQIREMGSSSYPAWMLAARTVLHTTGGEAWVHALSKRYMDKYNESACTALCQDLLGSMENGPGLCETFEGYDPSKCMGCPFKGKIKTPWVLAEFAVPKSVEMPKINIETADLTQGEIAVGDATETGAFVPYKDEQFVVIPKKGIYKQYIDDDGVPRHYRISTNEIYIHTLCVDYTQGATPKRTYIMRKIVPGVAPVDIPFAVEDALGANKTELWTAQCGLLPAPKYKKDFYMFLNTYISAVQNTLPEVYVRNHFGWVHCTDRVSGKQYPGFIVGQRMYSSKGESQVRLDERSASVATKLGVKGNLETWKLVPSLYKDLDQKFAQLLMCTAFGAPLMKFGRGTATNVAYNFWDINGGKGKSSMLKAVASVWGDPQQMLMGRTDTHAARFQQYAVYRNIPILIDELTGINDDETASLLYDIVNGREKARSTSSGTGLAQSGHWDTITIFTANQSMYESLRGYRSQSSATCMRLIETECDFTDYSTNPIVSGQINNAMTAARDNYGLAGPVFMEAVLKNFEKIKVLVSTYAEKFATQHAKSSDERFWLYGIAIPLMAGRIAKALGLLPYDMDALEAYCVDTVLPSLRNKVKVNKPTGTNLIMDCLNDLLSSTLIVRAHTRKIWEHIQAASQGAPTVNYGTLTTDPFVIQLPTQRLYVRREMDTGLVYISSRVLAYWCKEHHVSLDGLLQGLVDNGHMAHGTTTKRRNLGLDVPVLPQGPQTAYIVKLGVEDETVKDND